jgi:hypothetical protein
MFVGEDTILLDADPDTDRLDDAAVQDWDGLPEPLQLTLAAAALRRAAVSLAFQAETLAREMESGHVQDRGGPDALRLFATLVRVVNEGDPP